MGIVLVLLLGAGGAYYLFFRKSANTQSAQQSQQAAPQQTAQTIDTQLSEHYVSQDLKLTVDYPSDWQKDDSGSQQLKLESPITKLDGTDAKIVITLFAGSTTPPGFTGNSGQAVADSEKIAYTSPTQNQRKETYLSFVDFGSGSNIDAIYITGDNGYQKDQTVPKTDVVTISPIVSITFLKCEGTDCREPYSISHELWQSNQMLSVAKSIIQSLVIE